MPVRITDLLAKKKSAVVAVLGAVGLMLILLSSVLPDKKPELPVTAESRTAAADDYRRATEKRLETFLRNIEGAGDVAVYLTVGTSERYVYAAEEKKSVSGDRSEKEAKYVMTGNSGSREPLIETVEVPEITGAVIVCTGCGSAAVQERMYRAASAALGIPTAKIYVTKKK